MTTAYCSGHGQTVNEGGSSCSQGGLGVGLTKQCLKVPRLGGSLLGGSSECEHLGDWREKMTGEEVEAQHGSSTSLCDYIVEHQLDLIRPRAVVDFGAGGGKNGRLVRAILGTKCKLIGVEGFQPAADRLAEVGDYDRVDRALLQDWVGRDLERYDVAIFGDVLEHLPPSEMHYVMRKCLEKFDYFIIVVPLYDIYQDDVYDNPLEVHRAYVTHSFFDRYNPLEKHVIEGSGYTIMNVLIKSHRDPVPPYQRIMRVGFHRIMLILQPVGLARPFVDLLKRTLLRYKWLIR